MPVRMKKPEPIKLPEVRASIDMGLQTSGEIVKTDYKLSTGTWETETTPKWTERKPRLSKGNRVWSYKTKDNPFVWVDDGTEGPYPIPKTPKVGRSSLRFQTGFIPKTRPGKLPAGPGAHFGPYTFPKQVMHPGIEPRNISQQVAEGADDHLSKSVQRELDKARTL